MDDEQGSVVSLDDIRRQRLVEEMLEEGRKNPIEPNINLLGKVLLPFISLGGDEDLSKSHLRIVLNDVSSGHNVVMGALSLSPLQWRELRDQVDRMVDAHIRVVSEDKSG